ncbi:MAG: hypothetical protein D9V47_08085 [Clostridia bacterium]|nr:MAG: hypothetical protein D9V47_08085 [Clostridia bacterium]
MPKWISALLAIILVLGAIASLGQGLARYRVEQANKTVSLAAEYASAGELARYAGLTDPEIFRDLHEHGITAVFFKEQTLGDLAGQKLETRSGYSLLADPGWEETIRTRRLPVNPDFTYLVIWDESTYHQVREQLAIKVPGFTDLGPVDPSRFVVGVPLSPNALSAVGLGFPREAMNEAERLGLGLMIQVRSWPRATPARVQQTLESFSPYQGSLAAVFFNDARLPGYPEALPELSAGIRALQAPVGLVEFFPQEGLTQLARILDKDATRLHAVSPGEMKVMSPGEVTERMELAVTERNIRVLLIRFFTDRPGDPVATNLSFIDGLAARLRADGFILGAPEPFGDLPVSRITLLLAGLAVIAGGIWLLRLASLPRLGLALGLLAVLGWAGVLASGWQLLPARQAMAFAAVVIFPTLSICLLFPRRPLPRTAALIRLLPMTALSLLGALLMVGLISDVGFMLKLNEFRGVKPAHAVPLVLVALYFWLLREEPRLWSRRLRDFWQARVLVKYVVVAVILAVVGLVYITRTGNEAASVSGVELALRHFLDNWLGVRPRTKEFLIGHPFMLLAMYTGYRDRYLPLLLVGSIGQVSLVNTFAHVHTPLAVSALRLVHGLWLGMILGLVLILVWELLARLLRAWFPPLKDAASGT